MRDSNHDRGTRTSDLAATVYLGSCKVAKGRDFAMIMMLAAVVGALCQVADAVIELGRSAGWWP
jgi:hypothetical protein